MYLFYINEKSYFYVRFKKVNQWFDNNNQSYDRCRFTVILNVTHKRGRTRSIKRFGKSHFKILDGIFCFVKYFFERLLLSVAVFMILFINLVFTDLLFVSFFWHGRCCLFCNLSPYYSSANGYKGAIIRTTFSIGYQQCSVFFFNLEDNTNYEKTSNSSCFQKCKTNNNKKWSCGKYLLKMQFIVL